MVEGDGVWEAHGRPVGGARFGGDFSTPDITPRGVTGAHNTRNYPSLSVTNQVFPSWGGVVNSGVGVRQKEEEGRRLGCLWSGFTVRPRETHTHTYEQV